jgi:hypothetical protein
VELGLHLPICLRGLRGEQLHHYLNLITCTWYHSSFEVWSVCSLSLCFRRVTQKRQPTRSLFCSGFEPLFFCSYGVRSLWFTRRLSFLVNFLKAASYFMLNIKLPTFCPHSLFMCFVWISEQTMIIFPYSINWLVFITETECVYCAVRAGFLNIILVNTCHWRVISVVFFRKSEANILHNMFQGTLEWPSFLRPFKCMLV